VSYVAPRDPPPVLGLVEESVDAASQAVFCRNRRRRELRRPRFAGITAWMRVADVNHTVKAAVYSALNAEP
jgi:hypothetical protein